MTIRPIHSDADHEAALGEIARLWGAEPGTPEHDELEVLSTLVSAYEDKRWPIEASDPVEAVKYHMEETGRSQADLAVLFGSRSRASEVLNRKRMLTIEMAWKLHREWHIPAESLIRPYELLE